MGRTFDRAVEYADAALQRAEKEPLSRRGLLIVAFIDGGIAAIEDVCERMSERDDDEGTPLAIIGPGGVFTRPVCP